jgi:uncharacterized protein (TIGR02391 family)
MTCRGHWSAPGVLDSDEAAMAIHTFSDDIIENLARTLEGVRSHSQLTDLFARLNLPAPAQGDGPKWFRIKAALLEVQHRDRCGNNVGAFVETMLAPVNFTHDAQQHDALRGRINVLLAFSGLQVGADGRLARVTQAATLDEAHQRAGRLRAELERRQVHAEILRFCRPELLQQNYFHAVLEATKSVAARVRQLSGLTGDGGELVQQAFGGKQPPLAINTLATETEQSEQRGFLTMLIGMFGTFRNPTAHGPKIMWPVSEADALDLLSLLSYLHRRLDGVVRTPYPLPTR